MNNAQTVLREPKAPWLDFYGEVPKHLDYPDISMTAKIFETAAEYPDYFAYDYMNTSVRFRDFVEKIKLCARAFAALGVKKGDRVTVCLPNTPQTVQCFYALNLIGAVANMIHPLSSEGEIEFFLRDSDSVAAITLDQFYGKFEPVLKRVKIKHMLITSAVDELPFYIQIGYKLTEGKKIPPLPRDAEAVLWKDFIAGGRKYKGEYEQKTDGDYPAAILYSGGTTGTTKGILLTNKNFNALALQTAAMGHCVIPGNSMLSVMPMFHGFGLGVCIHTMLAAGCKCILIPRFNAASYAKLLKDKQPNYIAGVPTLYDAILRNPDMDSVDLSCLRGVFSGGDSLSVELKKKFDAFLKAHGSPVPVREGYGTTECVTASCLTPYNTEKEGSIGLPFPDTYYKIVAVNSNMEVPYGEEGEICLTGPSVMKCYVNQPEETANTLREHPDGHVWLHTGDLGTMDAQGFVYFKQRIKRMICSSGYSIYPSQLENILDAHPAVAMSCFIGVPDPHKIQKVKAFAVLKDADPAKTEAVKAELYEYCKKNIARYAMPYEIEIRESLPKTLVGKIAYLQLEREENEKLK